jgi:hypothetical protein
MSKKRDNLFELYIDKVVLGVAGLLSLWLLWVFVLGSPYATEYDGQKLSPGQIDKYIEKQGIEQLLSKLEEAPKPKVYDQTKKKAPQFTKMVQCSINRIDESVCIPIPGYGRKVAVDSRIYTLPEIGEVGDVAVEHYRSVVHKPLEPVGSDNPYSMALTEFGDIDIVTVQASFDTASLYKNFEQSFSGRLVRRDWQDKNLAKPVFAAVDLQRRRKLDNGSFGKWEAVGRTKVDGLKAMLESIPEKIDDKHTTNLLMVKFDEFSIRRGILQPATYEFAASNDDWLAPTFHKEYAKLMEEERDKLRREQQQFGRGTSDPLGRGVGGRMGAVGGRGGRAGALGGRGGGGRTGAVGGRGARAGGSGGRGGRTEALGSRGRGADRGRRSTRGGAAAGRYGTPQPGDERGKEKKKERKVSDVYEDFKKVLMTEKKTLDKMREPLLSWAHDDTVVPGESYQYRIRLGVFNPIAGRDWFRENQEDYKDKPILWSEYSKETEIVDVPLMMHFFPLDVVAKEEKAVKIKVAKFHNGKWRSEDFQVRPGEMIGNVVERKPAEGENLLGSYGVGKTNEAGNTVELIDFSTGASLVDVVQTSDWTGINRLQQRDYADVLYSKDDDEASIAHLAVKTRNWPEELQQEFGKIRAAESEVIQFRGRGQGSIRYQQGSPAGGMRPGGMPRGRMDMMMMRRGRGGRLGGRGPQQNP